MDLIPHTSNLIKDGAYWLEWSGILSDEVDFKTSEYDSPIDAAVEMVAWLLENNYINTK